MQKQILLLGSTKRKLAIFEQDQIKSISKGSSSLDDLKSLNLNSRQTLAISVRPDLNSYLSEQKIQFLSAEIITRSFAIQGLYEGLGADRLANLLGAIQCFPKEAVAVIDLGTCNTLSLIQWNSGIYKFEGGFICPGIKACLEALTQNTTSLPFVSELDFIQYSLNRNESNKIDSPIKAINEGVFQQTIALIEKIQQNHKSFKTILTGGWSELFGKLTSKAFDLIDPELPLKGGYFYLKTLDNALSK
jgi:pantothenate kinase type III